MFTKLPILHSAGASVVYNILVTPYAFSFVSFLMHSAGATACSYVTELLDVVHDNQIRRGEFGVFCLCYLFFFFTMRSYGIDSCPSGRWRKAGYEPLN